MAQTEIKAPSGKPNLMIKEVLEITPTSVKYAIYDGTVRDWRVPKNSTFNLNSILVGGSYSVWSKNINPTGRPSYDWVYAQPVGAATKNMHANMVLPTVVGAGTVAATTLPLRTLREDVADLIEVVAGQALTPEMEALLVVLCEEMDRNPNLFADR